MKRFDSIDLVLVVICLAFSQSVVAETSPPTDLTTDNQTTASQLSTFEQSTTTTTATTTDNSTTTTTTLATTKETNATTTALPSTSTSTPVTTSTASDTTTNSPTTSISTNTINFSPPPTTTPVGVLSLAWPTVDTHSLSPRPSDVHSLGQLPTNSRQPAPAPGLAAETVPMIFANGSEQLVSLDGIPVFGEPPEFKIHDPEDGPLDTFHYPTNETIEEALPPTDEPNQQYVMVAKPKFEPERGSLEEKYRQLLQPDDDKDEDFTLPDDATTTTTTTTTVPTIVGQMKKPLRIRRPVFVGGSPFLEPPIDERDSTFTSTTTSPTATTGTATTTTVGHRRGVARPTPNMNWLLQDDGLLNEPTSDQLSSRNTNQQVSEATKIPKPSTGRFQSSQIPGHATSQMSSQLPNPFPGQFPNQQPSSTFGYLNYQTPTNFYNPYTNSFMNPFFNPYNNPYQRLANAVPQPRPTKPAPRKTATERRAQKSTKNPVKPQTANPFTSHPMMHPMVNFNQPTPFNSPSTTQMRPNGMFSNSPFFNPNPYPYGYPNPFHNPFNGNLYGFRQSHNQNYHQNNQNHHWPNNAMFQHRPSPGQTQTQNHEPSRGHFPGQRPTVGPVKRPATESIVTTSTEASELKLNKQFKKLLPKSYSSHGAKIEEVAVEQDEELKGQRAYEVDSDSLESRAPLEMPEEGDEQQKESKTDQHKNIQPIQVIDKIPKVMNKSRKVNKTRDHPKPGQFKQNWRSPTFNWPPMSSRMPYPNPVWQGPSMGPYGNHYGLGGPLFRFGDRPMNPYQSVWLTEKTTPKTTTTTVTKKPTVKLNRDMIESILARFKLGPKSTVSATDSKPTATKTRAQHSTAEANNQQQQQQAKNGKEVSITWKPGYKQKSAVIPAPANTATTASYQPIKTTRKGPKFLVRARFKNGPGFADGTGNDWFRQPRSAFCGQLVEHLDDCTDPSPTPTRRWSFDWTDNRCYLYDDPCAHRRTNSFITLPSCLKACWRPDLAVGNSNSKKLLPK